MTRLLSHTDQSRLDSELYGQRWMAEKAVSAIKRRFGPAVYPRAWYREFRELVLTAAVYTLNGLSNSNRHAVIGFNKAE